MKKTSWSKGKLAALATVAFMAAAIPYTIFTSGTEPKPLPTPTPIVQVDVPVQVADAVQHREGILFDYNGINHPERLMETIKQNSQDKVVFVMFHDPACPHCKDLKEYFNNSQPLTELEYDVLLVNVPEYRLTAIALGAAKEGVPETYIFYKGEALGVFGGAPREMQDLLNLMDQIQLDVQAPNIPQNENINVSSAMPSPSCCQ